MPYAAELDKNNVVIRVLRVAKECVVDENEIEQESLVIKFFTEHYGGVWVPTYYPDELGKSSARQNYAGPGYIYDVGLDVFLPENP